MYPVFRNMVGRWTSKKILIFGIISIKTFASDSEIVSLYGQSIISLQILYHWIYTVIKLIIVENETCRFSL